MLYEKPYRQTPRMINSLPTIHSIGPKLRKTLDAKRDCIHRKSEPDEPESRFEQPQMYRLLALLTDNSVVSEFSKFYDAFSSINAEYLSIIDLPLKSAESPNNERPNSQPKFYTAIKSSAEMKQRISWPTRMSKGLKSAETMIFVPIGHGFATRSVLIGSHRTASIKEYPTVLEDNCRSQSLQKAQLSHCQHRVACRGMVPIASQTGRAMKFVKCRECGPASTQILEIMLEVSLLC